METISLLFSHSPAFLNVLSYLNSVHTLPSYFLKIHLLSSHLQLGRPSGLFTLRKISFLIRCTHLRLSLPNVSFRYTFCLMVVTYFSAFGNFTSFMEDGNNFVRWSAFKLETLPFVWQATIGDGWGCRWRKEDGGGGMGVNGPWSWNVSTQMELTKWSTKLLRELLL